MIEKVYELWYSDCIYESAAGCISLHRTKKGAKMAMEFHKEEKRKEYEKRYKDVPEDMKVAYDSMCEWGVREREVIE